jgi:hypothetical protein
MFRFPMLQKKSLKKQTVFHCGKLLHFNWKSRFPPQNLKIPPFGRNSDNSISQPATIHMESNGKTPVAATDEHR